MFTLLFLVLLISPFLANLLSLFFLKNVYKNDLKSKAIFLILGLCIGFINTLKVPESDLLNYIDYFNLSANYNFFDYIILQNKAYVYFSLNYISYYLLGGNFNIFIILYTGISYFFIFSAIRLLDKKLKLGYHSYLLAIIITVFFPNIFSISAHLMRQFLAISIIIFFIIKNIFDGDKKSVIYFFIASLIHSSSLFFIILFFPGLNKKISLLKGFLFLTFTFIFFYSISNYSNFFQSIPILGYAINRFLNKENAIWETGNLSILIFVFQFFILLVFYLGILKNKIIRDYRVNKLFYITFFLVIFIIANYNNTEIALRFNFYIYFLLPISFYFIFGLLKINRVNYLTLFNGIIFIVFFTWFFIDLINGRWEYNSLENYFLTLF